MKKILCDNPVQAAANHLAQSIKRRLEAGDQVLWFLSGGSGAQVVIETARQLAGISLSNLSVTMSDERFGPVGHSSENWQQLLDAGLDLPGATLYRTLVDEDRTTTTDEFGAWVMQHMDSATYSIGIFGIGADGHTAGIKPHTEAVTATAWAADYTGDDFERITITPFTIRQLDEAVIQASGADKVIPLSRLLTESLTVSEQPAQVLKSVPLSTLYTDNTEV